MDRLPLRGIVMVLGTLAASWAGAQDRADTNGAAAADCCDFSQGPCGPAAYSGTRVALIVGNDNYDGALSRLANAANDARAMATMIKSHYVIRCILNANRVTFNRELQALRKHVDLVANQHLHDAIDGRALLYFSGHGFSVDDDNYIVLAGTVADKADLIENHSRLVSGIALAIGSHVNFKTNLVFDSCRNFVQGQPEKPDWAGTGFNPASTYEGINIIFSTGPSSFARDEFNEDAPTSAGAYMHTVRRYAIFAGLTANQLMVSAVASDPGMRLRHQIPTAAPGDSFDLYPWTGQPSQCATMEAYVVNAIGWCRSSSGDPAACMKPAICPQLRIMALSNPVCSAAMLTGLFSSEIGACTDSAPTASVSEALGMVKVAGVSKNDPGQSDAGLAAAALQAQAQRKQLAAIWRPVLAEQLATIDNLQLLPGNRTATRTQTGKIQQEINRKLIAAQPTLESKELTKGGLATTSLGSLSDAAALEFKVIPSPISGSTGRLKIKGPVVANCTILPCTEDYAMTQVQTDDGLLKAWIETDRLSPLPPRCSAALRYEQSADITPTNATSKLLEDAVSNTCITPGATVWIIASLPSNSDNAAVQIANQRVALIRNALVRSSLPPAAVKSTFVQSDNLGSATPVSVQVR